MSFNQSIAMALIRLTDYWRIIGAVHSNLNYMENELVAKPTPERNPLLSQKINMLYHLLTSSSSTRPVIAPDVNSSKDDIMATYGIVLSNDGTLDDHAHAPDAVNENDDVQFIENDESVQSASNSCVLLNKRGRIDVDNNHFVPINEDSSFSDASFSINFDQSSMEFNADSSSRRTSDDYGNNETDLDPINIDDISFGDTTKAAPKSFENEKLRLKLPIKVAPEQRLLMIKLGDDFTHIWFPAWRRVLQRERILASLAKAKATCTTIDLSHPLHSSKVVVTHTHERSIFIGPYDHQTNQNVGLFMQHNGQMLQTKVYNMDFPDPNRVKSKGKIECASVICGDGNNAMFSHHDLLGF